MKYLLMIHVDPDALDCLSEHEQELFEQAHRTLQAETQASGELLSTQRLSDPENAAVIRAVGGSPTVTDGPYAEMKEFMGGYYLVDVDSPARAADLAQQLPEARLDGCAVEVRPVMYSAGADL